MRAVRRSWWAVPVLLLVVGCGSSGAAGADGPAPLQPLDSATTSTASAAAASPSASAPSVAGPSVPASSAPATPSAASAPAHTNALPEGQISGNLGVVDQSGDGSRLRMSAEIDGIGGWVVVQTDKGGKPGSVIGLVHRDEGVHDDVVVVPLRPRVTASRLLWVTLYLDRGKKGVFQPGRADRPLQFIGRDLRRPVHLTVTG